MPKVGCGPLDEKTILAACDPDAIKQSLYARTPTGPSKKAWSLWRSLLWFATLVTITVLTWIIYTMVSDYQSWRSAIPVNGVVVAMTPDGPFPDQFVIEYMLPNGQLGRATVPSQYTTARELEDEVELVYREKDPGLLGFRKTLVTRKDSNPTIVSQRGFPQPEIR